MKFIQIFISCFLITMMVVCTMTAADFTKGQIYHGFKLLDKHFVKEVNAECLYFEHVKSGARLFKIANDDPNKTFSIAFKTDPESDCGTPHIMEHCVLNGSKNFPVKSPFDVLVKGSLNTYFNAFTSSDFTCFPFANMNDKDYFNVMNVYLDAVFNPLIYKDARILKQEGWHYELEKKDAPIVYKGVVYNEMKGAYSNPLRELNYLVNKNLFPDNGYRFTSGGYPAAIPKLTYEMFLNYHKKYYHPVNSHIMLYGNADLDKELEFIDTKYLSHYDKAIRPVIFPLQKPFGAMKEVTASYPVAEGSETKNQTFLTLSFVSGLNTDRATTMALNIIADLLVNQEAAPVRLALQEAGIGQDVNAGVNETKQNVFQIQAQNANAGDKDKFHQIVMSTLKDVVKKGFDKKAVEGAINRAEFQLREGDDAQKGITYNFQILPGWFFADDPYLTLEYEKPLVKVKTAIEGKYFETILQKFIIDNPHALLLVLEPKPGMEKDIKLKMEKELDVYKSSLADKDAEKLVKETQELMDYQKREDAGEDLAKMPLLERKDISPKSPWYALNEQKVADVPVLFHEEFTNDVVYANLLFDMRVLPVELIQYSALLAEVLGSQNTKNYSYGDLDVALNMHTGGFSTFISAYLENLDDNKLVPKFAVTSKVMNKKVNKMFDLLEEIVNKTSLGDEERLKAILVRHQARLDAQIKRNGYPYARMRTASYYSNVGMFNEMTGGIEYYRFISDLVKNFDSQSKEIVENLTKTASLLFKKDNMIVGVTCGKNDLPAFVKEAGKFIDALPKGEINYADWKFNLDKKNEGFLTASKVQYVIKGYNLKKLGYEWSGKMRVLSQILSSDWLQTRVRVMGGAYGGNSSFTQNGQVLFSSYRDPNLKETLDNYNAIPDYLDKLEVNDKDMTRYIIGTVSGLDRPLTPSQKGENAVSNYLQKIKPEDIQRDRDEVISTTLPDVKGMKKMVSDILGQNAFCVYGNEEKIKSQTDLFGKVENLSK
jgi:presequence protease